MNDFTADITYLKPLNIFPSQNHMDDFRHLPRPHHIFSYIISGTVEFISDSDSIRAVSGDIVFIPQGTEYFSLWHGKTPHCVSLFFDVAAESETFKNKKFKIEKIPNTRCNADDFIYIEQMREKEPFLSLSRFYKVFDELYGKLSYTVSPPLDERIRLAVRHIENNYKEDISVDELALLSNMSTPNFYRRFKEDTGLSPIKYKNKILITAAQRLLSDNPDMSIEEISCELGFASSTYFRRIFKETVGKTPSSYRKAAETL